MDNTLPVNAGLTARVVYVQTCRECRNVVEALCLVWVANPSIGSFQCIASKKNHCCENGDALPRVTPPPAQPPPQMTLAENVFDHCEHGLTKGCCLVCDPEPISDTNGSDPEEVLRVIHATPGAYSQ